MEGKRMVDMRLGRIVLRDGADQQWIYLYERDGRRGFPIVIGTNEAGEIQRVVQQIRPERPLTHQLAFETIKALGAHLAWIDIVDLRNNTFFAQLVLQKNGDPDVTVVDARPSDAVALALRAGCPIRVTEDVLEQVRTDTSGPDPLPDGPDEEIEENED